MNRADRSAQQVLEAEVLNLRAKLLEVAAGLDRIDRGAEPLADAGTMETFRGAIETLLRPGPNRAERIQLLFSRAYEDSWRENMEV
ncbi:hypothetical protein NG895_25355 [Aeoliella sp. ICT_H6.2]|uniref:Uncharacterized protein n=1 Tax=Aeoliella straminimaris TaxID=2954799 RepID=A0A9X2FIK2_9BACT|nr:hypothetical protein [Aeoliella straminimaris]MCO6047241.1 hypothetical protein [Aeoliella straminimaris]